jgi:hypothetical protein
VADRNNEDHARPALNLYFEFFKHFTTLTTATALVVLAFYGALEQSSRAAYTGWIALGVTLLLSLLGMLDVLSRVSEWGWGSVEGPGPWYWRRRSTTTTDKEEKGVLWGMWVPPASVTMLLT